MLSISTRCHFGSDDETTTTSKIYDADFPPRESARKIHSRGQTPAQFSIDWHLSIIETLVSSFFRYRRFSPSRPSAPFRCLPTSVNPPAFPSPISVSPTPPPFPENMPHTNKTTQAAQRISMPFLSYRRATNERTVHPPSAPFFRLLCFIRGTGIAHIHVVGDVISDCCAFRSITGAE